MRLRCQVKGTLVNNISKSLMIYKPWKISTLLQSLQIRILSSQTGVIIREDLL